MPSVPPSIAADTAYHTVQTALQESALRQHPEYQYFINLLEAQSKATRSELLQHRESRAKQRQAADGIADRDGLWDTTDNRTRKMGLYGIWRQSTILGSSTDVIAKRFISGNWDVVPRADPRLGRGQKSSRSMPKGAEALQNRLLLLEFLANCNEHEDFWQMLYKICLDLLIFGESYLEVVYKNNLPYELYSCPSPAMDYIGDGYGTIKYFTYRKINSPAKAKRIDPKYIIRIWLPDLADILRAFSPVEGMVDPLYSDNQMVKYQQKTFENMGTAAQVAYIMPAGSDPPMAQQLQQYLDENYSGTLNAGRERVLYGDVKVQPLQIRQPDQDFLQGRANAKSEVLGRMHVPPAMVSQIEAGNLGGGTGEAQEKSFILNVLQYLKGIIFEKLTYQLVVKRFDIHEWVLDLTFADYITDQYADKVRTVNEVRVEAGRPSLGPDWDTVPLIAIEDRYLGNLPGVANNAVKPNNTAPPTAKDAATANKNAAPKAPAKAVVKEAIELSDEEVYLEASMVLREAHATPKRRAWAENIVRIYETNFA